MKRFQIGFAAIIAVLAMSFTVAKHTGAFDGKKRFATDDCFRPEGASALQYKATCPSSTTTLLETSSCFSTVGQHIYSLDANKVYTSGQISSKCPGNGNFCCLQVVEDLSPCIDQPTFNIGAGAKHYKISAVFCKL